MFKRVDANIDLPSVESEISGYWDKINAFETSVEIVKMIKLLDFMMDHRFQLEVLTMETFLLE